MLKLSAKCRKVTGVDLSERMIAYARTQKERLGAINVDFVCDDGSAMRMVHDERFSFAIVCMCLHGMSWKVRRDVMKNCFAVSQRVIVTDYVSPFPKSILAAGYTLLEVIEGRDSYRNFREWQREGGIDGFIKHMGLNVVQERPWTDGFGKTGLVSQ